MSRFGTDLLLVFLDNAWPGFETQATADVTWDDVVRLFFDGANAVRQTAENSGRVWSPEAVEALDKTLMEIAANGQYKGFLDVGPEVAEEFWRRWEYALIAAELERIAGTSLNLPMPRSAPAEIKGWALVLYVLGGPAHDYRRERYPYP